MSRDAFGPIRFVDNLASYISDPSRIRALAVREFGAGAPSLARITALREKHVAAREKFKAQAEARDTDPKLRTVEDRVAERAKPAPVAFVPPPPTPPPPSPSAPPLAADAKLWPSWYKPRRPVFASEIISGVANDFGMGSADVIGKDRRVHYVAARSVVARILRNRGWSYPKIGMAIGGRDHSTVINLVNRFDVLAGQNELVRWSYAQRAA